MRMPVVEKIANRKNGHQITTSIEDIGPRKADEYLDSVHPENRAICLRTVSAYSRDMQSGGWSDYTEIRFDAAGRLIDGQHRMSAILESGATQTFLVIRGLPESCIQNLDAGRKRTVNQTTKMMGTQGTSSRHIAAGRLWLNFKNTGIQKLFTRREILVEAESLEPDLSYVLDAHRGNGLCVLQAPHYLGFCFGHKAYGEKIISLLQAVQSGENLTREMPAYALREHIISMRSLHNKQDVQAEKFLKTLNAIYHYNRRSSLGVLKIGIANAIQVLKSASEESAWLAVWAERYATSIS